jgi:hypothetical protein
MSAQGGTLARRGTMHLPIWPVAAVIVAIVGTAVGLAVLGGPVEAPAPVREQAAPLNLASNPGMWTQAQAEAFLGRFAATEASAAAIREQGAGLRQGAWGVSHVAPSRGTYAIGLENPGAYGISQVTEGTFPIGLENPGAYPGELGGPRAESHRPPVVNGELCGQCR